MSRILFIDDEERRMAPYVEELREQHHTVVFAADVDTAVGFIDRPSEHFDLVILDISLPTGDTFETTDTDGGSRTGLALFDRIRSNRPLLSVVIFTNVPDQRIRRRFSSESHCSFVRKNSALPFQFGEIVEEILRGSKVN